jgi:tyrosine-protein kinase Etk/Wzc
VKATGILNDPLHAPSASGGAEEFHLLDLLTILAYRRRFILWFCAVAAVATGITVFLLPSKYTAVTVVLPPMQSSTLSPNLLAQLSSSYPLISSAGASLGVRNPAEMCVALFRSRTVEDALIERFGLMTRFHRARLSDARLALEKRSSVTLGTKDGLISISVTDDDPAMAAALANGYVDEFRKFSANLAYTEASQRRLFFQQQLTEANNNLSAAEETLKKTEQSTGAVQLDSQTRSLVASAATLRGDVTEKEVELEAMRTYATEDNPQVQVVERQLVALKDQLRALGGTTYDAANDVILPKGNVPQAEVDYLRALRDMKYYETIADLIGNQFELAKLDEAREGATIQVADIAVPPDKRSSPKRTLTVLVVTAMAFFAACAGCLLRAGFERLRNNPLQQHRVENFLAAFRKSPAPR